MFKTKMMKLFLIFFVIISLLLLVGVELVYADRCLCQDIQLSSSCAACPTDCADHGGMVYCDSAGISGSSDVSLDNPLGEDVTAPQLIGKIINAVLGIVGSLALVMFIYGGFIWMTSSGNMEMVTKGKNILIWATLGLVVIFASYAIVHFIIFEGINPTPTP